VQEKPSAENVEKLQELVNKVCLIFYDMKIISPAAKEDSDYEDSLMKQLD
jgi:hypothetical protein